MQGIHTFIPTETKAAYINKLLAIGFDTIDFGSFVSPKAIPQMRDTADLLRMLDLSSTASKLLAIVANRRGAEDAIQFDEIQYLGFPFSVSETFQQRNANSSIEDSLGRVEEIQQLCEAHSKTMVVYLSMAFGNPYGDPWSSEIVCNWGQRLADDLGVKILAPSDTIGTSSPESIRDIFRTMIQGLPHVEVGAHLHTTPDTWRQKVEAVFDSGCQRMDGAIKGFGGCPMAKDDLTGNMPTEQVVRFLNEQKFPHGLNETALAEAVMMAGEVMG
ncbi:MAG: hydroxymethylglutaryl-CoA lyase [Cryomorphaceae bacterium]|nr:MAG: hydroxymethylglutaryl-CoA lyase [Cryomorphaceae bacterium]